MFGVRMSALRGRSGGSRFTLVEMLVVIAIIGILASILMPVLQNALSAARLSVCGNNLKQIGFAFQQYADDHRRLLRVATEDGRWMDLFHNLGYYDFRSNLGCCPSYAPFTCAPFNAGSYYYTYGNRQDVNSIDPAYFSRYTEGSYFRVQMHLTRIKNPSRYFQCGDNNYQMRQASYVMMIGGGGFYMAHNNSCNAVFLDGHVELIHADRYHVLARGTFTSSRNLAYTDYAGNIWNLWLQ